MLPPSENQSVLSFSAMCDGIPRNRMNSANVDPAFCNMANRRSRLGDLGFAADEVGTPFAAAFSAALRSRSYLCYRLQKRRVFGRFFRNREAK